MPGSEPGGERTASGIPIVPALDGFRAIGIVGIVILHTFQATGIGWGPDGNPLVQFLWACDIGQTCLNALFIVSGFVIYLPIVARGGRMGAVGAFAIRRAARLFPAYWFVLLVMLILIATLPFKSDLVHFPSALELGLTITTMEVPAEMVRFTYFLGFGMNRAIWTLSLDVTFYVLLMLLVVRWYRRPLLGVAIAVAVALGWRFVFSNVEDVASLLGTGVSDGTASNLRLAAEIQFPFWAMSFAAGMSVAQVFSRLNAGELNGLRPYLGARLQIAALIGAFLAIVGVAVFEPTSITYSPLASTLYTALIALFMLGTITASPRAQAPLANRAVRWTGDVSYGTYLIHLVILTMLLDFTGLPRGTYPNAFLWIAIVVPLSILWGWGSQRLLEQPTRQWASKHAIAIKQRKAMAEAQES
ncbi:MAG: acyltransferase [Solirubrobacterales bacterium]